MNNLMNSARRVIRVGSVELEMSLPNPPNVTWLHVWTFSEIQNAVLESSFVAIPNEILLCIFQLLSVRDLCNVSLVCRLFKMIADQDEIWKLKCNTLIKLYFKSYKQIYMDSIYVKFLCKMNRRRTMEKRKLAPTGGFNNHPKTSFIMTIELSVNIDATARELIKLREKALKFREQWQQSTILKQMIIRYYRFMQLKASHPTDLLLVPTLDIEIIWQTHLLRPEIYQADCIRLFHRIIDHKLLTNDIEKFYKEQAFRDTCQLYEQKFGENYCLLPSFVRRKQTASNASCNAVDTYLHDKTYYTYWDKTNFELLLEPPKDYENPFSFTEGDMIVDMNWLDMCKIFMVDAQKKTSVPFNFWARSKQIDLQPGKMERLKKSYERFLYIAAKYPLKDSDGSIFPTYAIEIMWHAHMQEPLNYAADCVRLVGYVIFHNLWSTIKDDNMQKSSVKTSDIWKQEFGTDIITDHL
ncbi:unnamed protein product [Rotaria sp. Silwood1]|nr:unnamed protein product [Rotaria sp. Silwood1]